MKPIRLLRPLCVLAVLFAEAAPGECQEPSATGSICAPSRAAVFQAAPFDWQSATPQSQGLSREKLDALKDALARNTKAFLVIRNDRIVLEWYAASHSAKAKHYIASVSKPIVGGLALALALADGRIRLDDKASRFLSQWADDPRKSKITIRHLGSHTSGLADAEENDLPHEKLTGWKGDFWKRHAPPNDPFTIARDKTPALFEPGTRFQYSNPGIAALGYCVTAASKEAPEKDVRSLLRERILRPIGVPDEEWSVGYGQTIKLDGLPLVAPWGGGNFTARALARVGRLMLRKGDWDGKKVLTEEAVRLTTSSAGLPGECGMGWWTNADGRYKSLPRDAYWAAGAGHQILLVVPSLNLIMVRQGAALGGRADYHEVLYRDLFAPLMSALEETKESAAPYPPSKIITRIDWAPKESIIRLAKDSDNWPMTWGDDGDLYTAFGDGFGFDPKTPYKLGLGFAKITGDPPNFKGINIRAPETEDKRFGAKGKKASGMLMVDGVLYCIVRNVGNAQLGWSTDRSQTWTWSDWKFTSRFGCPTFLNFGKNYAGARDDYVYIYSHDADSAYVAADRMVLARVPKDQIKKREAFEFFKSMDNSGQPIWTKDIGERGPVLVNPGKCYRSGITYNAGLKRYLWCQTLPAVSPRPEGVGLGVRGQPAGDARFKSGFGIYDAPEPWGPWTTVFYTEQWDVGPGETSSFPTKWMSADGTTLHLVFSGDDCFSVRKAQLIVAASISPSQSSGKGDVFQMNQEQASLFARLALKGIHKEYPNKPADVLNSDKDVLSPRAVHPAFYGCFDWHSSVHGHWMLVRLLRLYPELPERQEIRAALAKNLTAKNLQMEADYFARPNTQSFERPYGWAWLLKLAEELHGWDDPDGKAWSKNVKPLADKIAARYVSYFPKQTYPIRSGVHSSTAFGLAFAHDYARTMNDKKLLELVEERSRTYFAKDENIPAAWEPDGADFFSPSLMEADLMRRVLPADEFSKWFERFLPKIAKGEPKRLLFPATVTDRSDPQIVHLDGLNLSRAWCMRGIARNLQKDDPARKVLEEAAARHAEAALRHVASGDYAGEHWLASFAVYLLTEP
ncbi:MAG: DUF2891 family protein [Gemmataceae bacterium]|nr:DUF2891 family protein [Gemmataceae bacterium]